MTRRTGPLHPRQRCQRWERARAISTIPSRARSLADPEGAKKALRLPRLAGDFLGSGFFFLILLTGARGQGRRSLEFLLGFVEDTFNTQLWAGEYFSFATTLLLGSRLTSRCRWRCWRWRTSGW